MIMNLKAGDEGTNRLVEIHSVCVCMCMCVCSEAAVAVVSQSAGSLSHKQSFSAGFEFVFMDTSTHTRTHTKWMMWSQCYGALCSPLQSVPVPQTKAINRMKLAVQSGCCSPSGLRRYRSNCDGPTTQISPLFHCHCLCLMLLLLYRADRSGGTRTTREMGEGVRDKSKT